jgi:flagellar basal body P-ring formation protein FlgA
MIAPILFLVAGAALAPCHPVTEDRILGRDLAAAIPAFASMPSDAAVGLAPFPGQQRLLRAGELQRIATTYGVSAEAVQPVCFAWPMSSLSRERVQAAMAKTLEGRNPQLEIVELSNVAVPPGEVTFPLSGLAGVSEGPVLWRGYVTFAERRLYSVWARVQVKVKEPRVVAAETLKPGDEIRADQLHIDTYEGPLTREAYVREISSVEGWTARNRIAPGVPLTPLLLRERLQVERGDLVQVVVELKQTRLEAQGVAEESGAKGALITVRNARSGRKFRARVADRGKVMVVPEGPTGLVVEEARHEASS